MLERISDLDEARLMSLTDEEVQQFVDIEAAYAGLIPVPDPGVEPIAPSLKPTVQAFKVGDLIFADQEEAGRVASMSSMRKADYEYNGAGYQYQWLDYADSIGVTPVWFYDRNDVKRLKNELVAYRAKCEAYKAKAVAYQKYQTALSEIRNGVLQPIQEALEKTARIEQAKNIYARHLELAKGDAGIAANFFRNAYNGQPDLIEAVLGEVPEPACAAEFPS